MIWPQLIFHYSPLPSSCPLDTLASLLSQNMPSTFPHPSLYPCCVLHLRLSFTKYPPGSLYSKIPVRGHLSCPLPHLKYFTTFSKSIFISSTENHLYSSTFLFVCSPFNASLFHENDGGRGFVHLWFRTHFQCLELCLACGKGSVHFSCIICELINGQKAERSIGW